MSGLWRHWRHVIEHNSPSKNNKPQKCVKMAKFNTISLEKTKSVTYKNEIFHVASTSQSASLPPKILSDNDNHTVVSQYFFCAPAPALTAKPKNLCE
jgi:homoaconitase/3-isopropylmalate dehydratase large subunit